jgi:hypothetical protein
MPPQWMPGFYHGVIELAGPFHADPLHDPFAWRIGYSGERIDPVQSKRLKAIVSSAVFGRGKYRMTSGS